MDAFSIMFYAVQFSALILALSLHEASHAFAANKFGDPTAKMLGRLSLNPIRHIDPIGTVVMPLIAIFTNFPVIGWAKPVPVNSHNLRDPKLDHAFIAAAGPASNLVQAFSFTVVLWLMEPISAKIIQGIADGSSGPLFWLQMMIYMICTSGIVINILLAIFNLIPIPPLDGGWILGGVLPDTFANFLRNIGQFGFIIIMLLLYGGFFGRVLYPIMNAYLNNLLPENGRMIISYIFSRVW